jgi:hypothetical protein
MDTIEQNDKKLYTEAQKRATKKYRENHKEKVNEQRKKYYNERVKTDPEFVEYKRMKSREYYHRKKDKDLTTPTTVSNDICEHDELPAEIIEAVFDQEIVIEETPKEVLELVIEPAKKKRIYKKPVPKVDEVIEPVIELVEEKLEPTLLVEEKIEEPYLKITPIACKKYRTKK